MKNPTQRANFLLRVAFTAIGLTGVFATQQTLADDTVTDALKVIGQLSVQPDIYNLCQQYHPLPEQEIQRFACLAEFNNQNTNASFILNGIFQPRPDQVDFYREQENQGFIYEKRAGETQSLNDQLNRFRQARDKNGGPN